MGPSPSNEPRGPERIVPLGPTREPDEGRALTRTCRTVLSEAATALNLLRERIRHRSTSTTAAAVSELVLGQWRDLNAEVRDCIVGFGREARATRMSPEQMVHLVKAAAQEAGVLMLREPERSIVLADVLHWSVDGYYSANR